MHFGFPLILIFSGFKVCMLHQYRRQGSSFGGGSSCACVPRGSACQYQGKKYEMFFVVLFSFVFLVCRACEFEAWNFSRCCFSRNDSWSRRRQG